MSELGPEHARFRILAAAAVDGRLSTEEAEELEAHLATCATCRAEQQALLRDHEWLARPGPVAPPSERVRAVLLRAAASDRRGTGFPWLNLLAASLVIAVAGVGAIVFESNGVPGLQRLLPVGSPAPSQRSPEPSPVRPSGDPFAYGTALFVPAGDTEPGEIEVALGVSGGIVGGPTGSLNVTVPDGESWRGTITAASYWFDPAAGTYGLFIQGCRVEGGACKRYALEILDGSLLGGPTTLLISWPTPDHPDAADWQSRYQLDSGAIQIGGSLVTSLGVTALPADSEVPDPSGIVPFALGTATLGATGMQTFDVVANVVGGRGYPVSGYLEFTDTTAHSWSVAVISADYWHDESGSPAGLGPYVAFIQGCVAGPECVPLAIMIIDDREMGVADHVRIAWGWTRPTAESGGEYIEYDVVGGTIDVGGCMATVINGAMTDSTDDDLCGSPQASLTP